MKYHFGITLQQDLDIPIKNSEKDTHLLNYSKSNRVFLKCAPIPAIKSEESKGTLTNSNWGPLIPPLYSTYHW